VRLRALDRVQIYKAQKIINYASVTKRGRLLNDRDRSSDVTSNEGPMKSFQSNALLVMTALPNHDRPSIALAVIIISVTVKKDST